MADVGPHLSRRKQLEWLCTQIEAGTGGTLKYQAVSSVLMKALSDGMWEAGEKLPTESELACALALSHGTVQKAYQVLVGEGLVVRRRGSGSYVTNALRQMAEPWHCRFLDDDDNVLPVFSQVIDSDDRVDSPEALRVLGEAAEIGRIDRKIRIGGDFMVFSRFYASGDVIQALLDLSQDVFDGANFKSLLLRELGRPVVSITQTVIQSRLDGKVAGLIGCRSRSQGLRIQAIARTREYEPIYYQVLDIPPTTRRLLFESVYRP